MSEAAQENILFTGSLYRSAEPRIVPGVHRSSLDDWLARKNVEDLEPNVSAGGFRFEPEAN